MNCHCALNSTNKARNIVKIQPNGDIELKLTRMGGEDEVGPDRILECDDLTTWDRDGKVKLRVGKVPKGEFDPEPTSVVTYFERTVKRYPKKEALGVKREGKWIKWNYQEYHRYLINDFYKF